MVNVECDPKIADLYGKETTRFFPSFFFFFSLSLHPIALSRVGVLPTLRWRLFLFPNFPSFFLRSQLLFFFLYFGARAIRQQCQLYLFFCFKEKKTRCSSTTPTTRKDNFHGKSHKFSNVLGIGAVFFPPFPFCFLLLCSPSGSTRCYGILLTPQTLFPPRKDIQ